MLHWDPGSRLNAACSRMLTNQMGSELQAFVFANTRGSNQPYRHTITVKTLLHNRVNTGGLWLDTAQVCCTVQVFCMLVHMNGTEPTYYEIHACNFSYCPTKCTGRGFQNMISFSLREQLKTYLLESHDM